MDKKANIMCVYLLLILTLNVVSPSSDTDKVDSDLVINAEQQKTLAKFKTVMSPLLPHEYMKEDVYLIKWLRARRFKMEMAREMLLRNIKWRALNKIDTILDEEITEVDKEFQQILSGVDKEGRPVIESYNGEVDVRQLLVTGQEDKFIRSEEKIWELVSRKIRDLQANGKQVSQFHHIHDLDGYNLVQTGCPRCVATIIQIFQSFEQHYPGSAYAITVINAPSLFQAAFEAFKGVMSPETSKRIKIFGKNKSDWQSFLSQYIDTDQLSTRVGGTMTPVSWWKEPSNCKYISSC